MPERMPETLGGLRKSAIVLLSLGEQHAAEVLRHLDEKAARAVRREMARVGGLRVVSLHTRQKVLGQFCADVTEPMVESSAEPERPLQALKNDKPFASFQNAGAQSLIDSIRDEHPQTIALVLAHLPHEKAGEVLAGLDHQKKVEVIKRIAGIDQTNAQVIEQVEQGLRERLSVIMGNTLPTGAGGGVSAIAEILNSADRAVEEQILHDLDVDAPDLAEQIRRVQVIFEDLLVAADQDIRSVIEQLDHETIAMALRTARIDLRRKVLWNLPAEQARQLEQELEQVTPASVSEIEAAQQRVAEVVHRLDAAGEIEVLDRAQTRRRKKAV